MPRSTSCQVSARSLIVASRSVLLAPPACSEAAASITLGCPRNCAGEQTASHSETLEHLALDRITNAVMLPVVIVPCAAVVAICIGILLHQFSKEVAPFVALALVLIVTA